MSTQLDYYTFMGFNPEELKQRYAIYADRFKAGSRVLDIGCGRGEFLELLAARRIHGVGVDSDEAMVNEVGRKGLEAVAGDGIAYLEAHPAGFDGIFAAHLIEHLAPEGVQELVQRAAQALKPQGRLILVTPNPQNLQMQLRDFWIDLQHVRFYSPEIVRWIAHQAGLREIEIGQNPSYRSGPAPVHDELLDLPLDRQPARTLERRVVNRLYQAFRHSPIQRRVRDLERRTNALVRWMQGLYPPAEYFVTGVR
jgi:O-antigen chain-terminating methyltransferase